MVPGALLAVLVLFGSPASAAQSDTTTATARWSNGAGDCGDPGSGGAANGTGFFEELTIDAEIVVDGDEVTITFLGVQGPIFNPVQGTLGAEGPFELTGRDETFDEDYTFAGLVSGADITGTFTRLAHYLGSDGPRCTATWDVAMTTEAPIAVGSPPPTAAPLATSDAATAGDGDTTDDGTRWFPWLLLAAGVVGGAGVWFTVARPRKPDDPRVGDDTVGDPDLVIDDVGGPPPPDDPPRVDDPPCGCSGHIPIIGRDTLRVCPCMAITWTLRPFAPAYHFQDQTAGSQALQGALPGEEVFCIRRYSAERAIVECVGGATVPDGGKLHGLTWTLARTPTELTIRCSATVKVHCPTSGFHDQAVHGEMVVRLVKSRCQVSLVVNQDDYWKRDTGHTGTRIRCGEYDAVFGYYPDGAKRLKLASGFKGSSAVQEVTSRDDESFDSLSNHYRQKVRYEFIFEPSCEACDKLRDAWRALRRDSGRFDLYNNNCTVQAVKLVHDAGVEIPDGAAGRLITSTLPSPSRLYDLLEEAGVTPVIHDAGARFAPPDHEPTTSGNED